jgi:hypothetical protein
LAVAVGGTLVAGGVAVGPGGREVVAGRTVVGAGIDVVVFALEEDAL